MRKSSENKTVIKNAETVTFPCCRDHICTVYWIGTGGIPRGGVLAKKCASCGEEKKAHHTDSIKKNLNTRLARIEGQIRGVNKMIAEDVYCDGILNQITSIQAALNGVRLLLLENHVRSCVVEQITQGEHTVIDELMKTISRMTKQ